MNNKSISQSKASMCADTINVSGHIVDVLNRRMFDGTVSVVNGVIDSISEHEVEADAPYIMPGFYDAHMHIESTLMLPENYAKMAVVHGTIGCMNDPHEIANVLGVEGVKYMLDSMRKTRFHFHTAASPCVPSTTFETSGATLDADALEPLLDMDEIYGLGEVMNVPGVLNGDADLMRKIQMTLDRGKLVDAHITGASPEDTRKYLSVATMNNHECVNLDEAHVCLDAGAVVAIREGSAACDFDSLWQLLNDDSARLVFCTDDIYPDELQKGYINLLCARAVAKGAPLWNVLRAACVTPVQHYHLSHGLLQKGDKADFICVNNLTDFEVLSAYIDGCLVAENGKATAALMLDACATAECPNHFLAQPLTVADLRVEPRSEVMRVIGAHEGSLVTDHLRCAPVVDDGQVVSDVDNDVLKVVCYSRHSVSKPAVGFIRGFALKRGAMASTIGHDSHNIIAIGTNDEELVKVINALIDSTGGLAASDGNSITTLDLPVAGLMSPLPGEEVAAQYTTLLKACRATGCPLKAPFMTMAFMSLPVIPWLKITDLGLFDYSTFSFTDLFES